MRLDLAHAAGAAQEAVGILAPQPGGALGREALDEGGVRIGQLVAQQVAAVDQAP